MSYIVSKARRSGRYYARSGDTVGLKLKKARTKLYDDVELRSLMPHQANAVAYLMERFSVRKGGNLFMEMRLGKTLSFIRFARAVFTQKKILVICPLSVCKTWEKELRDDGILSVRNVGGIDTKTKRKLIGDANGPVSWWTINNFESCTISEIHEFGFDVIVVDESVRISNPNAAITKYLLKESNFQTPYRYCLSGNPAPEGIHQYITQMLFSQGRFLGHLSYWATRAALFTLNGFEWVPADGTDSKMHAEIHAKSFILTREKAGIGSKKIYAKRYVQMNKAQATAYNRMMNDFELDNVSTNYITTQILYLNRIAGGMLPNEDKEVEEWISTAKFDEVIELLGGELKGQQCLVWCRFRAEARKMEQMLREKFPKLRVARIDGSVGKDEREEIRLAFLRGEVDVSVQTISSSKIGTDWSSADTEIYLSNEYSADARTQSEDRIVHPKKQKPLLVIDIITECTIDDEVVDILREKRIDSKMFMGKLLEMVRRFKNG